MKWKFVVAEPRQEKPFSFLFYETTFWKCKYDLKECLA
jgi:hypothetical protein